jgi:tetratricopeptide (TPR) repeat protein
VKGRVAAGLMAALLVLYLLLVVQLAFRLIAVDLGLAKALGIALIVLPLLGFWALVVELLFGIRSGRLVQRLAADGDLPADNLPRRPSGRPDRSAADAEFPLYRAAVEADPDDWRAWLRLGMAYDASGDRRRARQSIRRAIQLERDGARTAG